EKRQKTQLDGVSTPYLNCLEPCRFFNMRVSKRSATFWLAFGICCTLLAGCATSGSELRTPRPILNPPAPVVSPSPPPAVTSSPASSTTSPVVQSAEAP